MGMEQDYNAYAQRREAMAKERFGPLWLNQEKRYVHLFRIFGNVWYVGDDWVCVHLIDTGDGLLLIDSGNAGATAMLVNAIWEAGFNPADVKWIIHSHGHLDHIGGAMFFKRMFGTQLLLAEPDARMFREQPWISAIQNTYNDCDSLFVPDYEIKEGDVLTFGSTVITCYLFYVSDKRKVPAGDMQYIDESDSPDPWFRLRRQEILTPGRIVEEAEAVAEKYGMKNFKLKGGVLRGEEEMEAVRAVKKRFPDARVNIDPNGAWSLKEAIELCRDMHGVITYMENPCGPEAGFSGREIMREFKNATQFQVATNMIATDWRQFYHTASLNACDIILADPHFWGFDGAVRMSQLLEPWGLTFGIHSNNHFDITLAAFAQVGAAAVGRVAPLDTHWIWQDGQNLLEDTPQIIGGKLQVPQKPGLGVTLDMKRVEEANRLYNSLPSHDRNDSLAMQYLIPGWKYDRKKPCLVR